MLCMYLLSYTVRFSLEGHTAGITAVRFSPDGRFVATGSADATVKLWHAQTGAYELTLAGHVAGVNDVAWSPDSTLLATASDDKTVRVFAAGTGGACVRTFRGHANYVTAVDFNCKGNLVASGSFDESIKIWDLRRGTCLRTLPAHSDPVAGLHFSRDGTLIVSGSHDGQIRLWDVTSGQCLKTIIEPDNNAPVSAVKFSPNGRYLLSSALDGSVRLWDYLTSDGRCVRTFQSHKNDAYALTPTFIVFTSSSSSSSSSSSAVYVVCGSESGEIFFWDLQTKQPVLILTAAHVGPVLAVDAHPSGSMLASAGIDHSAKIWIPINHVT
ncbi:WD40-repeat-containing domain protein [Lipomyces japonicus]|uniref:WD40-repeat-containing domain protein n=1 Tax=Lipomyces japonicus TaxID=56871 RepID=UPI0034CE5C5C